MAQPQTSGPVLNAAAAIGSVLSSETYAIVGGAACVLLGSRRVTKDVDFVVLKGKTAEIRRKFRESEGFVVESGTAHTTYQSVEIEILTPPVLFQESFDANTPTVTINGIHVLKPTLILNAKCNSILGRSTDDKKLTDASDIQFLLQYIAQVGTRPDRAEVPAASKQFVEWFVSKFGLLNLWTDAGYNPEQGSF